MATRDPLKALRVPGRVCINPTDNPPGSSVPFPFGGIELGLVRDVVLRRRERRFSNTAEEFGGEPAEELYLGETWDLLFALRGFDNDAIQTLFPNTTAHALSGQRGIVHPGSNRREGSAWSTASAVRLLFAPDEPLSHPGVYFRSAIPLVAEELELPLSRNPDAGGELLIAVAFRALRDQTQPDHIAVRVRLLEDMVI